MIQIKIQIIFSYDLPFSFRLNKKSIVENNESAKMIYLIAVSITKVFQNPFKTFLICMKLLPLSAEFLGGNCVKNLFEQPI